MTWWKTPEGAYLNSDHIYQLVDVELDSTHWRIHAIGAAGNVRLAGEWATAAEAKEVIRRLAQGFDPSSLS